MAYGVRKVKTHELQAVPRRLGELTRLCEKDADKAVQSYINTISALAKSACRISCSSGGIDLNSMVAITYIYLQK